MIVKPFSLCDLGAFIPNEYSNPDEVLPLLTNGSHEVHTLWGDDGLVQAIIAIRNYWGRCWSCFVLISRQFQLFNSIMIRGLLERTMVERSALRLQTESRANTILRKWHRFLGFTHEGTKRKMMFNQDYDCWAIVREEA